MAGGKKDMSARLSNRRSIGTQGADLYAVPTEAATPETSAKPQVKQVPKTEKKKPGRKKLEVIGEAREHFSSSLKPSYKRKIKLAALGLSINDYEVLDQALDEWFAKHKKEIEAGL